MRLKGVKISFTSKYIRHAHFRDAVLSDTQDFEIDFAVYYDIVSKDHKVQTVRRSRTAIVPFNDKKYFDGSGNVFSFGHKDIPPNNASA